MPIPDRKLRVFLCHASQDKPIVRELYQQLLAEGWIDPWLDEEKLLPGQDWDLEIEKAVETADAVIVCLSNNSVSKEGYIQRELRRVLDVADEKPEGAIFVIPVRVDDVQIPRRIKMWHYVDLFPSERKVSSIHRLIASLKIRAKNISTSVKPGILIDDSIAVEICILDIDGKNTTDFWFITAPDVTVEELLASIKADYPTEIPGKLTDYIIDCDLQLHYSINNLKVDNGTYITIRPKAAT